MTTITRTHDEQECHRANNKRRKVIDRLRELVDCLHDCDRYGVGAEDEAYPPKWAVPLITYPQIKDKRPSTDKDLPKIPPWEKDRKSIQIMAGNVVKGCQCTRRNGLQADCKMTGCQGSTLCLTKPYPLCPNGDHSNRLVTPEQAEKILAKIAGPELTDPEECVPGRACRTNCYPCSGSLEDICRYIPEWTENPGNSVPKRGSFYDPDREGMAKMSEATKAAYKTAMQAGKPGSDWWCCVAKGYGGH